MKTRPSRGWAVLAGAVAASLVVGCSSSASVSAPKRDQTPSAAALTKAPINIGTIGIFSGYASTATAQGVLALKAWVEWKNATGGINGHPVKLFVEDDGGSPTKSLADIKQLVQGDHVIAIVAQHEAGLEGGWENYIDHAGIPVIGGIAASEAWLTDKNFFPSNDTPFHSVGASLYAAHLAGQTTYGIAYCAEVSGCAMGASLASSLASAQHETFVGGLAVSQSSASYLPQCQQLSDKKAGAVFVAISIDVTERLIADCARQNYHPVWVDDTQNWGSADTTNPIWQGASLYSDGVTWLSNEPSMVQFRAAMAKYEPEADIETTPASSSWAAANLFAAAAVDVGATPTSAQIYKGLYSLGPNFTLGGTIPPVTFTKGEPAKQKPCAWFMTVANKTITTPHGTNAVCFPG